MVIFYKCNIMYAEVIMNKVFVFCVLLMSQVAIAGDFEFKIRAREHFETHKFSSASIDTTYRGLSNTINLWWEKPYDISYGFSVSPILSGIRNKEVSAPFGEEIILVNYGFEMKYFLKSLLSQLYVRPGITYAELSGDQTFTKSGHSLYLGLGYEYPFERFGLAFEVAHRYTELTEGITVNSFTPSIGFHFYGYL